jgi:peptidyl-prolyl cis-trans isomerase A (cyclophilin A)
MTFQIWRLLIVAFVATVFAATSAVATDSDSNSSDYDKTQCTPGPHNASNQDGVKAPDHFYVEFQTTVSDSQPLLLEVNRTWAPLGVDRFYGLVRDNYYDCAAFFRVVPGFVVQWGIASDPEETGKWDTTIPDDPVFESNKKGFVTFAMAGPDTRTTQIYVNTEDNTGLDGQGFAPFARVVRGMDEVFSNVDAPKPDPDQGTYMTRGNSWILDEYPGIDIIKGTADFLTLDDYKAYRGETEIEIETEIETEIVEAEGYTSRARIQWSWWRTAKCPTITRIKAVGSMCPNLP